MRWIIFPLALSPIFAVAKPVLDASQMVNRGGLRIFQAASGKIEGNLCLSPYSIQFALAMTYAGAAGTTREQMASTLSFEGPAAEVAGAFSTMDQAITAGAGENATIRVANRLFGSDKFTFRPAFLRLLQDTFRAPMETLDFATEATAATALVNAWVAHQTEDRIRDLVPPGAITADTLLVLVNALYLKAGWETVFQKSATRPRTFSLPGGETTDVPMMNRSGGMGYLQSPDFTLVGLPLSGSLEFVLLLPNSKSDAPGFPDDFDFATLKNLTTHEVDLTLPKFRLAVPTIPLGSLLQDLGMPSAFDVPPGSADFSGMAPPDDATRLAISDVFHKTFVEIDEAGLEAAAATAVTMMRLSLPVQSEKPIPLRVDRPFLFIVRHIPTNVVLFLGRITDPR